jgi:quercetin dioxygenase-like cupin family protein
MKWQNLFAAVTLIATLTPALPALSQQPGLAKPNMVLRETVSNMPRGEKQEISVMTASFKPGDRTVFHTHRFPVTVYVLEGTFTLELEGRAPLIVKAGESLVEPPNVKMTGYNRSATEPLKVVIFYVGDAGTPFLDPK